jgi:hypothetical protein
MKITYDETLFCSRVQSGAAQTAYRYKDRLPAKSWETKEKGNDNGNDGSDNIGAPLTPAEVERRFATLSVPTVRYVANWRTCNKSNRATLCTIGADHSRDLVCKVKVSGPITQIPQTVHGVARYAVPVVSDDGETVRWTTPIVVTSTKGEEIAENQEKLQRIANKHKREEKAYREENKRMEKWERRQSNKKAFPWGSIVQGEDRYGTKKESE